MSTGTFQYFFQIPQEIRVMIINQMYLKDRCRFTRTCKKSEIEAKSSKDYLHNVELRGTTEDRISIVVRYHPRALNCDGYCLCFFTRHGNNYLEYSNLQRETLYTLDLPMSDHIWFMAASHFNHLLLTYHKILKKVAINGWNFTDYMKDVDFGVPSLNNLQNLHVNHSSHLRYFLSKIGHPLELLECTSEENDVLLTVFEQIQQVQWYINIPHLKLNYNQFLTLSAIKIKIHIGFLTMKDIYNLVNTWQHGAYKEWDCTWLLDRSSFRGEELFSLFGSQGDRRSDCLTLRVNHQHLPKSGRIDYYDFPYTQNSLEFRT